MNRIQNPVPSTNHGSKRPARRLVAVLVALLVVAGAAGAVFAATATPTAEPASIEAWKDQRLADAKENLDARVEAGTLTQADADALYARIEANVAACTATEPGTRMRSGTPAGGAFRNGRGGGMRGAGLGGRATNGAGAGGYGAGACGGASCTALTPAA